MRSCTGRDLPYHSIASTQHMEKDPTIRSSKNSKLKKNRIAQIIRYCMV